jgi:transposase-like protein
MDPQQQFCPNSRCHASGVIGEGNIVSHSLKPRRYKCKCCGKTFSATRGTATYGIKKPTEVFVTVVTLLAHGCPVQAIVAAFGLDERTVSSWLHKAGQHSQEVHAHVVGQAELDLGQVQADEIKVKTQLGTLWLALAMMVPTRLWLGGVVSAQRDWVLIQALVSQVRRVALCRPLLLAVDGLASYVKAFRSAFRSPLLTGQRGRPRLIPWDSIAIVQVVKQRAAGQWSIERRIVQGGAQLIASLLATTQPGSRINTAYVERLNATFRQRLGCLARRTRALARSPRTVETSMYLLGCVYNLCTWHQALRLPLYIGRHGVRRWVKRTPAMAAGLTDHRWSIHELLHFKVPTSYQPPKRRGRPRKIVCSCGLV